MKRIYSLILAALILMSASFSFSQVTSFGRAPETQMMPGSVSLDNPLNANNRGFVYISGTNLHQWGKQFMGNVTVTNIGSPFTTAGWIGATARNTTTGMIYVCNQAAPFQIWSLDTTTGAATLVTSATGVPHANFTGMVWDHTTSTMYGISSDLTTSRIFTINLSTGVCTPIGSNSTVITGGIGLYCAPNGTLFSNCIVTNNLFKWNKTTGVATTVGPLNYDANYGQDGSFDLSDGMLYLASAGPGNILRVCDTTTGNATTVIGTYSGQPSCLTVIGNMGPAISHTPLPNTQNLAGPYAVNAVVTPAGSPVSTSKIFWSRNNPTPTDSVTMTNTGGNNWTGNIPGNGTVATYRYYIKAIDGMNRATQTPLYTFLATNVDTTKPVISHTPITSCPKAVWPATVNCAATDPFGIDSVWVGWKKGAAGPYKRMNLTHGSGDNWAGPFNSIQADVNVGDTIFYRVIARDKSAQLNKDSTVQYNFKITSIATACIGTGATAQGWPFYTFYMDSKTQMLFTAAEIIAAGGAAGTITKVGYNVISAATQPMSGFKVNIQQTTATTLSSFLTTGWTTCYTGTYTVPGTGWQYITLQNGFVWNGTSSVVVEICFNNSSYTSNSTVASTAATGKNLHQHSDLSSGDGCVEIVTPGTTYTDRPNTCFEINTLIGTGNNSSQVPATYSLSQNYPNPFNPVTKINFAIPKQGFVTLKVYDVLGREIKTLVNEIKTAGEYSVDFNASEFSSGVYFYRLESQGFTDIKRMMLIK